MFCYSCTACTGGMRTSNNWASLTAHWKSGTLTALNRTEIRFAVCNRTHWVSTKTSPACRLLLPSSREKVTSPSHCRCCNLKVKSLSFPGKSVGKNAKHWSIACERHCERDVRAVSSDRSIAACTSGSQSRSLAYLLCVLPLGFSRRRETARS